MSQGLLEGYFCGLDRTPLRNVLNSRFPSRCQLVCCSPSRLSPGPSPVPYTVPGPYPLLYRTNSLTLSFRFSRTRRLSFPVSLLSAPEYPVRFVRPEVSFFSPFGNLPNSFTLGTSQNPKLVYQDPQLTSFLTSSRSILVPLSSTGRSYTTGLLSISTDLAPPSSLLPVSTSLIPRQPVF